MEVSSYRDVRNPGLVHFPGTLASYAVLGASAGVCLLILAVLFWGPADWTRPVFAPLTVLVLAVIYRAWPRRIALGEQGAWQYDILGRKRLLIPWGEMAPAQGGTEVDWLSSAPRDGFPATRTVVLSSMNAPARIVLTPRHADHDRFAKLVARRRAAASR